MSYVHATWSHKRGPESSWHSHSFSIKPYRGRGLYRVSRLYSFTDYSVSTLKLAPLPPTHEPLLSALSLYTHALYLYRESEAVLPLAMRALRLVRADLLNPHIRYLRPQPSNVGDMPQGVEG